ncbi:Zn-dependent hydrolase [Aureitalea marina]|uniref:Zn-dependent hydrolase n=1 Tax=Aureitalea marina TaxID=930804 RepID=A0A2S7KTF7_9FLAO|nr:Zn-dependent hydrolase [Aureitalea marina]PQB05876.1 Zn-dependent hydrolase [Aureitalea marina]
MRSFISFLLTALIGMHSISIAAQDLPKVDQDRLEKSILDLGKIGVDEMGTQRVAFSQADLDGRDFAIQLMKEAGLEVHIDLAGNIIGSLPGSNPELAPISFGSHIDTVPNGGNYDGCVGSMAAIEVVRVMKENGIQPRHPMELIIFSNEEGGVMGSRAISGKLPPSAFEVVNSTGFNMADGIDRLGGDHTKIDQVIRNKGEVAAFVELHIEQGGLLEQAGLQIGIVEGIVGLNWWDVTFTGFANHAGTTPMDQRQDALLAAAQFIQMVNQVAVDRDGRQVATVGRIKALPGAPNVIPGKVVLSLEIRDLAGEVIREVYSTIEKGAAEISKDSGVAIQFEELSTTGIPALTDPMIQKQIEASTNELGLSFQYMPSGAGHDAQDMALITPTGMIFVPSKGGISHSPKEFTTAEDMANGANVLLRTLLKLDKAMD